jgi:phosphoglycolate phosphatase
MYQYLLFDLDGTLTDSQEGITKSVDYALRTVAGIQTADLSTLTAYIGPPLIDGFMENHHLDDKTAAQCKKIYRSRYETIGLYENRVYAGIPEALSRLRAAGFTLAVATSKPEPLAKRILVHFGLDGYFTEICGATLDGRISQKEDVIAEVLRRLGHPAAQTVLMIGDRRHDVQGAKTHGLNCLGALWGFGTKTELQTAGAALLASTPEAMTALLCRGQS